MSARGVVEAAGHQRLMLERVERGVAWLRGKALSLDMPVIWRQDDRVFDMREATEIYFDRDFRLEGFVGRAVIARSPSLALCVVLDESGGVDGHWVFKVKLGLS